MNIVGPKKSFNSDKDAIEQANIDLKNLLRDF